MHQIGRNIFSLGLSRVVSGVILFVVYIKFVAYLGPGEFGKFSLVLTYFTVFSLLLDFGVSRFVIKEVSADRSRAQQYLDNFLLSQSIISLMCLALFLALPRLLGYEPSVSAAMALAGVGLLINSFSYPFSALLQAWQKIHWVAIVNFVNTVINAAWLLYCAVSGKSFAFAFWAYVIIGVVDVAIYTFSSLHLARPAWRFDRQVVRKMFLYGLPFALISGFEILISKIDVVIQKFFVPFEQIGLYSAAYRFLDILTFIPAVIAISLFPLVAEHANLQTPQARNMLGRIHRYLVALAWPLAAGGVILAKPIIVSLFGADYAGAAPVLQVLIWTSALTFWYGVANVVMIVRKTALTVWVLLAVTLLNALLNIILLPYYGIIASAWVTVGSYLLTAIVYLKYTRGLVVIDYIRPSIVPVVAAAGMGLVVWRLNLMGWNVFLTVAAGVAIYFGGLVMLKYLKRDDWEFLKSFLRKTEQPS